MNTEEPNFNLPFEKRADEPNSTIILYEWARRILRRWPLLLFFLVLSFLGSWLFLRYATKLYLSEASMLIEKGENERRLSDMSVARAIGMNTEGSLGTEVMHIQSRTLMEQVVRDLKLHVFFFSEGNVKKMEVYYKDLPFELVQGEFGEQLYETDLSLEYIDSEKFYWTENGKRYIANFGKPFRTPSGIYQIDNRAGTKSGSYEIRVRNPRQVAKQFRKRLNADSHEGTSVITLSFQDALPGRGNDILNYLMEIFALENVKSKTMANSKTVAF